MTPRNVYERALLPHLGHMDARRLRLEVCLLVRERLKVYAEPTQAAEAGQNEQKGGKFGRADEAR